MADELTDIQDRLDSIERELTTIKRTRARPILKDDRVPDIASHFDVRDAVFPPLGRVFRSTAQSIPTATWTKIELDTAIFDDSFMFDGRTANAFTIKTAGIYLIIGRVSFVANATGTRYVGIVHNSNLAISELTGGWDLPAEIVLLEVTCIRELDIGDTIELYTYQNSGANLNTYSAIFEWTPMLMLAYQGPQSRIQPVALL